MKRLFGIRIPVQHPVQVAVRISCWLVFSLIAFGCLSLSDALPVVQNETAVESARAVDSESEVSNQEVTEQEVLPSAQEVIDHFIEASGGPEKMNAIQTTNSRARLNTTGAAEMQGILTTVWDRSTNSILMKTAYRDRGNYMAASNGELHWIQSDSWGDRIVTGTESEATTSLNNPLRYLQLDDFYTTVECVGKDRVGDIECYQLKLILKSGGEQSDFFAVESGLLIRVSYETEQQGRMFDVTATYSDFRETDGLIVPFEILQEYSIGMEAVISYEFRNFNEEIDKSLFEVPESIQALISSRELSDGEFLDEINEDLEQAARDEAILDAEDAEKADEANDDDPNDDDGNADDGIPSGEK